jgi:hypothetical protein
MKKSFLNTLAFTRDMSTHEEPTHSPIDWLTMPHATQLIINKKTLI